MQWVVVKETYMSRIIFWRAEGCYASALSILEKMEDRVGQTPDPVFHFL